ncbi:MAG: 1-deoxy-D-xylulose-5-phosphate synthase, partial [Candidatus Firestonebacteria bacterium]
MGVLENIKYPEDLRKLSYEALGALSEELREYVVNVVAKTGGHLASNLGVVELTIALHYAFNTPEDRIVWDVGHQAYIHKILTGRKDLFPTLRQHGGLSGFPKRAESIFDSFDTGHSGTSISAALGIACARDLNKQNYKVIAVTGDASLSNGMSLEAINNAGHLKKDLIVILNDNEMSISPNVGAIANYLGKIGTGDFYLNAKEKIKRILKQSEFMGVPLVRVGRVIEEGIKGIISHGIMFEEFGFRYFGPVDGHNIKQLVETMRSIKRFNEPVLLHIVTKKGKGYEHAEKNPTGFHGTPAFEVESGEANSGSKKSFTKAFGEAILKLARTDKKVVAITAAMSSGTGLDAFREEFPDRFFDVGIAEEHAVTFAAGLAANGLKPVFAVYSSFLQRSYDQVAHDVCTQNLPVVFAIDRAGIVGDDGETHQGTFDISYLRHLPNIMLMAPADEYEMKEMLALALQQKGPAALRYPRGEISEIRIGGAAAVLPGKAALVKTGTGVCILAV